MKLNEEYNIVTECGLVTCDGKRYDDNFAITHNWKDNTFNITHIASGMGIAPIGYSTLKDCLEHVEIDVNRGSVFLERNPEQKQRMIERYNQLVERNVFNN